MPIGAMEQETRNNLPYFRHIWGKPKATFHHLAQSSYFGHLHEPLANNR
jgi:hypothetical protein